MCEIEKRTRYFRVLNIIRSHFFLNLIIDHILATFEISVLIVSRLNVIYIL